MMLRCKESFGIIARVIVLSAALFTHTGLTINLNDIARLSLQKQIHAPSSDDFDWATISPSSKLVYTPCYNGFQCARLSVPLNWNDTSSGKRAALAVIRLPARVPPSHPSYGGAILTNPGGPGESGVHQIVTTGRNLQTIADSGTDPSSDSDPTAKYFDLVGFDPRSVKDTTPHLKCFPDGVAQHGWVASLQDYGTVWESDASVSLEWARMAALGQSCAAGQDNIIRYANTAQVAADLVGIAEAHGEWREAEVERLLVDEVNEIGEDDEDDEADGRELKKRDLESVEEKKAWKEGREMVQYWGTSYGTLLGQTFAAMFPDRAHRVLIDGVVSPDDYYNSTWFANLNDADKVMTKLAEYCFEAGQESCPLYTGESATDVENWIEEFVFGLETNPIIVPAPGNGTTGPEVITHGDVILQAIGAMAFPLTFAEKTFRLLDELSRGNTSAFVAQKQAGWPKPELSERCRKDGPFSDACISDSHFGLLGPTQSIECMDSAGSHGRNFTKHDFQKYYTQLVAQSKWFASTWARHRISCVGLDDDQKPAWTFKGPIAGNTSHPMLVISNSHDTVTPINSGRLATHLFPGSAMIHQNSEGHCSYSMPSVCTAKLIRQYFQSGQLPTNGTICQPDYRPFIRCTHKDKDGKCKKRSDEDEALWKALWGLAHTFG